MKIRFFTAVFFLSGLALNAAAAGHGAPKHKMPNPVSAVAASTPAAQGLPLLSPPTGPVTVEMVISRFEQFDAKVNTLSANFRQGVRMDESGVDQSVEGALEYHKPNLLRIEHRLPESQTIVADGTWLWVWRKDSNQVVQTRLEDWKKSEPLAEGLLDFGNYSKLLKTYDVSIATVSAPGPDGHARFELLLKPKDKTAAFSLTMQMTTADFFPTQTELRAGSILARTVFTDIRYNPAIPEARFKFTPPPDADVFQNFKPPKTE
jgi:outer membrane lipoprotein-sorting protein